MLGKEWENTSFAEIGLLHQAPNDNDLEKFQHALTLMSEADNSSDVLTYDFLLDFL